MPRNIEIKAYVPDVEAVARIASAIADQGPFELEQDDTFFPCESGRLKLRAFSSEAGELIFYRRPDQQGPKDSFYLVSTNFRARNSAANSIACLWPGRPRSEAPYSVYVGRTRVHLDSVQDLGHFLELEVVLNDGEPAERGIREAHELMARLGVEPSQLVEGAYVDLLAEKSVSKLPEPV